jgi:hypothetical protein
METSNLKKGIVISSKVQTLLSGNKIIEEFNLLLKDNPIPLIYLLNRCNVFKNLNALIDAPNDIILFEMNSYQKEELMPNFKGFLYRDNTVSGNIKYEYTTRNANEDDLFKGNYIYDSKGNLYIHGCWSTKNSEIKEYCFFYIGEPIEID